MELNLVNASIAAAGTFAMSVDERMEEYLEYHFFRCKQSDKYKDLFEYGFPDMQENVIGVLIAMLKNGLLVDICDGIAAYLDAAGIDHEGATQLKRRGCEHVLKVFAEILLREGAIDEIFDGDYPKLLG